MGFSVYKGYGSQFSGFLTGLLRSTVRAWASGRMPRKPSYACSPATISEFSHQCNTTSSKGTCTCESHHLINHCPREHPQVFQCSGPFGNWFLQVLSKRCVRQSTLRKPFFDHMSIGIVPPSQNVRKGLKASRTGKRRALSFKQTADDKT